MVAPVALRLERAEISDVDEMARNHWEAFKLRNGQGGPGSTDPWLMGMAFPRMDTPEGLARVAAVFRDDLESSDDTRNVIKVVDTNGSTPRIVGQCRWTFITGDMPKVSSTKEDQDGDLTERYIKALWRRTTTQRDAFMAQRRGVKVLALPTSFISMTEEEVRPIAPRKILRSPTALNFMAVLPEYQRFGVGRMLMDWGVRKADEAGLWAILEANPNPSVVRFYSRFGFEVQKVVDLWKEMDSEGLLMDPELLRQAVEAGLRNQVFMWMTRPPSTTTEESL